MPKVMESLRNRLEWAQFSFRAVSNRKKLIEITIILMYFMHLCTRRRNHHPQVLNLSRAPEGLQFLSVYELVAKAITLTMIVAGPTEILKMYFLHVFSIVYEH